MKIAICDDERNDRDVIKSHIKTHNTEHTVVEFACANQLLKQLSSGKHYDLLFLDVQMPNSDGWEIARLLKESKLKIFIAMITVLSDYMRQCFDRVDWFTPKPASMEDIHMILDAAQKKLFPIAFHFQSEKMSLELTAPEIWYAEVKINNVFIHTITNIYRIRKPLKEIKEQLSAFPFFVQSHQSYIVNLEHFHKICGNEVILKNGSRIPLSRGYKADFFNALAEFIKGN